MKYDPSNDTYIYVHSSRGGCANYGFYSRFLRGERTEDSVFLYMLIG